MDQLEKLQPGIKIADNPQVSTTCGGTVVAAPGSNQLSLTGGTVGPKVGTTNGECRVSVNVTSFTSGNLDNEFLPGDLTGQYQVPGGDLLTLANSSPVTETLNVADLAAPTVAKQFTPSTIWSGGITRLRITIRNNDAAFPLNDVRLADTLPAGLFIATPANSSLSSNCGAGATLTAAPGSDTVTIDDAVIPANAACYYDVNVTSSGEGFYQNVIPANAVTSYEGETNPNSPSAAVTVQGVQISKSFSRSVILAGEQTAVLTLTIRNPYTQALTDAMLTDALPAGDLVYVPGTASTTCQTPGNAAVLTLSNGDKDLTISNGTIPAGTNLAGVVTPATCTITVTVTAPGNAAGGTNRNTIPVGDLQTTEGPSNTNAPFADLQVNPQSIAVDKYFSPSRFELGGTTYAVINLTNPTSTAVPNVNLTDDLPAGLTPVSPAVVETTCGGTVSTTASSFTLSNGTIPANGSCSFRVLITTAAGATAGSFTNTLPANAITGAGITNQLGDSASVPVYAENRGVIAGKTFTDNNQPQKTGAVIGLTLTLRAPEDQTLTNVTLTDTLPAGLTLTTSSTPHLSNCGTGAVLNAPNGGTQIQLSNATIQAGQTCSIIAYVTGDLPGSYTNTISPAEFTCDQEQTFPSPVSDTLQLSDYIVQKSFSPAKISRGGRSVLTIRLTNENVLPMVNVSLEDRLNTMGTGEFTIAADPAPVTTCGGVLSAPVGGSVINLTGGTIPGRSGSTNGSCTVSVTVFAQNTANTSNNSISRTDVSATLQGTTTPVPPRYNAAAMLTVVDMSIELVKSFDPSFVAGGSTSRMTILLINNNDVPLEDLSFVDVMPPRMKAMQPYNIDTSTCGGEVVVAPDRQSFSFSGGYLAAGRRCTVSLNVTIRINGNLVNTIPAQAVSTFNGATNKFPASSTLTNLPGVSVNKYFTPDRILAEPGNYAILAIQLTNTSNAAVPDLGIQDTFPAGLYIVEVPGVPPTNSCGGTFTANPGENAVVLSGGYLGGVQDPDDPEPEECLLTVPVTSDSIGSYRNVIPEGAVESSAPNVTNADPAEDTLEVYGTPDMQVVKTITSSGPYVASDVITYQIEVTNTGDITLPNVQVSDIGLDAPLGICTPALGSSLAPAATMICDAAHTVTVDDMTAKEYVNTVLAESDRTDPVMDDARVPLDGSAAAGISKRITSQGPYQLGDVIDYLIVVKNLGNVPLTNVVVTELAPMVMGACTPPNGSTLDVGEEMVCNASFTVTQAAVDAGIFTNTVQVESDQTDPVTDDATTQIARSSSLAVYKYETSTGSYGVGNRITFDIVTENTGTTTLTGVTVEDTGTELPLGPCTLNENPAVISLPATLLPGDILYCKAYHDVNQADVDAGEYVNTAVVDSDQTTPGTGSTRVPLVQIPLIALTKTGVLNDAVVAPSGQVNAGDTITYAFTVQNTGNVTLYDITLDDIVSAVTVSGGPIDSLAPGASDSTTFTAVYSLQQADIDAGTFENTATVTAYDPQDNVVTDDDDDSKTYAKVAGIEVEKTGTLQVTPPDVVEVGDQITYVFTVRNTGNVTLTNIQLEDDDDGVVISGGPIDYLLPGQEDSTTFSGVYSLLQADIDAGAYTNVAIVSGTDPDGGEVTDSDDDTQTLTSSAGISLDKFGTINPNVVAPNGVVNAGDTITYAFTVRNTGNVTLSNIFVTDSLPGVTIYGNPIASLAPDAEDTTSITGVYTLTQADIDAGSFLNSASVSAEPPQGDDVTDTGSDTRPLEESPSILLTKLASVVDDIVAPAGVVNAGDQIHYTFTIINTGNVTLTNVTVAETTLGVTLTGDPILSLAPGQSNTTAYTATYTLTQADIDAGSFENTALVSGTAPSDTGVSDEDDVTSNFAAQPGISLLKEGVVVSDVVAPPGQVDVGDQIRYSFRVENTGNVTLYNITVTDSNPLVTMTGCTIAQLAPGEVNTSACSGRYTLTQEDIDLGTFVNTASVNAMDPNDSPVSDSSENTQELVDAGQLGLAKSVSSGPTEITTGLWQLTYALKIVNMGNVTLTDIQIQDDLSAVFPDPHQFTVLNVTSAQLDVNWPGYNGISGPGGDINLLTAGANTLAVGESGTVSILVEVIPADGGPFDNSATGSGLNPKGDPVEDESQDGTDPDLDPGSNDDPTPTDFGPDMFNPPMGIKTYANAGIPLLDWHLIWINHNNIVPIHARVSDPIPEGTTFINDGIASGYPLPAGDLPAGSTASGVVCRLGDGTMVSKTTTTYCYYEGPSLVYPRGRVVWEGTLAPDFGITTGREADNEIHILFTTRVNAGVNQVVNVAWMDVDRDGDGDLTVDEEKSVRISETWRAPALPQTGFAPGRITRLPQQPAEKLYSASAMVLTIPKLDVSADIVTVPFRDNLWDVTWLGGQVGYLEGSAYPTWNGNTVLTAHATTPFDQPGLFADLKSLRYGDRITITAYGVTYVYEVRAQQTILDHNLSAAFKTESYDWLTLMTCDGFNAQQGEYALRQLVRAVLISIEN